MGYKILYVEDLKADSLEDDLSRQGYEVITNDSSDLDNLFKAINNDFDAYLLDFRLTSGSGKLDAPAIAQAMRTDGINHKDKPIILISNDENTVLFDKDLTSQDLFDLAVSKSFFRKDLDKYSKRINSFIKAYLTIINSKYDLSKILNISTEDVERLIDYRLIDKLQSDPIIDNVYAYCRYINISLIRGVGPLVGLDILSSRLGVNKMSKDWGKLLDILDGCRYKGILSDAYPRWWMEDILTWWSKISDGSHLRRMNSSERVALLKEKTSLELQSIDPIKKASSSYFWTICSESKQALDPCEGYIIEKKDLAPWQEMEYLSLNAALEQSKYRKYLSPMDREEILNIELYETR